MKKEDEYVPWQAVLNNMEFIISILPQSSPAYKYLKVCLMGLILFFRRKALRKMLFKDRTADI